MTTSAWNSPASFKISRASALSRCVSCTVCAICIPPAFFSLMYTSGFFLFSLTCIASISLVSNSFCFSACCASSSIRTRSAVRVVAITCRPWPRFSAAPSMMPGVSRSWMVVPWCCGVCVCVKGSEKEWKKERGGEEERGKGMQESVCLCEWKKERKKENGKDRWWKWEGRWDWYDDISSDTSVGCEFICSNGALCRSESGEHCRLADGWESITEVETTHKIITCFGMIWIEIYSICIRLVVMIFLRMQIIFSNVAAIFIGTWYDRLKKKLSIV